MSNTALTASLVLKLEDQLSGSLDKLLALLDRFAARTRKLSMPELDKAGRGLDACTAAATKLDTALETVGRTATTTGRSITDMVTGAESRLSALAARARSTMGNVWGAGRGFGQKVGAFGAAAAGFGIMAPIKQYADYENILRHMAITEGLTGAAVEDRIAHLGKEFKKDALKYGQTSKSIAHAAQDLLMSGMSMDTVLKLLPAHSMAATAYNISPEAMGQAVYSLNTHFGIDEHDMKGALASMALSTKHGKFTMDDMSRFVPQIGSAMKLLGMTGRGNADMAFAALQTVRMNTGDSSTAATNLTDLLHYMTAPIAVRSMGGAGHVDAATRKLYEQGKLAHIDLPGMYDEARRQGVNPLMAFLGKLQKQVVGQSPEQAGLTLGHYLHNQQAGDAARALIMNASHFLDLMLKLKAVDENIITNDFITAFRAPAVQLRIFEELLDQLTRRLGEGFVPVLVWINTHLNDLIGWLDKLDDADRQLVNHVTLAVGSFLALAAAAGLLSVVLPAITAGLAMILSPLRWLATLLLPLLLPVLAVIGEAFVALVAVLLTPEALLIALAVAIGVMLDHIVRNWDLFRGDFLQVWNGMADIFKGVFDVFVGLIEWDGPRIMTGLRELREGVVNIFSGIFNVIRRLFSDFWNLLADSPPGRWVGLQRTGVEPDAAPRLEEDNQRGDDTRRDLLGTRPNVAITLTVRPARGLIVVPDAEGALGPDFRMLPEPTLENAMDLGGMWGRD